MLRELIDSLNRGEAVQPRTQRLRDLLVIELGDQLVLVLACDSDGGIGPKSQDTVNVPGELLGRFAVRVPLMEILASGAKPVAAVDALTVEMDPTGLEIIRGVRAELIDAGLNPDTMLTGSTEDNVPTVATGIGVTILGLATRETLRPGMARAGDSVVAVGLPKSAPEDDVRLDDPDIAAPSTVQSLTALSWVHDILPVGSKGAGHELNELAVSAGLTAIPDEHPEIALEKSAGPSTCVLAAVEAGHLDDLKKSIDAPIHKIATLEAPD
jgi:hypothetical protein